MATRVSQGVVEVLLVPTTSSSRVTQNVVEAILRVQSDSRVSQAVLEILLSPVSLSRVSQAIVEVIGTLPPGSAKSRVTQLLIEVVQQYVVVEEVQDVYGPLAQVI